MGTGLQHGGFGQGGSIVSTLASGTEIVCALGLESRLVGISHECDFPPSVLDRPRVTRTIIDDSKSSDAIDRQVKGAVARGDSLYVVDEDRLASLQPDVIITQSHCDVCAVSDRDISRVVERVDVLKCASVVSLDPTSLESVIDDVRRVGRGVGEESAAGELVAALASRIRRVRERAGSIAKRERIRVACIEWIEPLMIAANWMPELIANCGGACDLTSAGDRSSFTHWDDVRAFDPEVIVVMPCGFPLDRALEESRSLRTIDGWSGMTAVREGRVFAVDGNAYFNRSGPRLVDSQEMLAGIIYPHVFSDFRAAYAKSFCVIQG